MKKRFRRIELTKEGKMITAGAVAAIVLLALLAFFFLFRVDKVYVVGNTRYTDEEVKERCLRCYLKDIKMQKIFRLWILLILRESMPIPFGSM